MVRVCRFFMPLACRGILYPTLGGLDVDCAFLQHTHMVRTNFLPLLFLSHTCQTTVVY